MSEHGTDTPGRTVHPDQPTAAAAGVPEGTPLVLHPASLHRLAELGAGARRRPGAGDHDRDPHVAPPPAADPDTRARADAQLRVAGIAVGGMLDDAWGGVAATLAAPTGRMRFERQRPGPRGGVARADGWLGTDGVLVALHAGPAARRILAAPTADALPLVLALLADLGVDPAAGAAPAPAADPVTTGTGAPADEEPVSGRGDPTAQLPALTGWTDRWRIDLSWRHRDGSVSRDGVGVVVTPETRWLIEPDRDDRAAWSAVAVPPSLLWRRLLALLPAVATSDDERGGGRDRRTCRLPALGLELDVPASWSARPVHQDRGWRLDAPDPGPATSVLVAPTWTPDDLVAGLSSPLVLEVVADRLLGRVATRALVHHLDGALPVCSVIWTLAPSGAAPADDTAPPAGWRVVATAATGRFLDRLPTLGDVVASLRDVADGPDTPVPTTDLTATVSRQGPR